MRVMIALAVCLITATAFALEPIPGKLVVLTFDDSVKSHFTVVRPILKKYKFGATFFVTEGFDFKSDKENYMTWDEIARLHQDGFEIGNHTRDHLAINKGTVGRLLKQIEGINKQCEKYGILKPISFAYPANSFHKEALPLLAKTGIRFARRGSAPEYSSKDGKGVAYEPGLDHPLLIPSAGVARPEWTLVDFKRSIEQARHGRIAVLQFHGVPDKAHPWVHTPVERFEEFMKHLADNKYHVIAMRDLAKFVDTGLVPKDPLGPIEDRKQLLAAGESLDNFRHPENDADLRSWLENMVWHHRYSVEEVEAATGLLPDEVIAALNKFDIRPQTKPKRSADAPILVLPFPGGRHPRTGFLDGCIRPQRETKVSVFTPWDETSYFVLDIPEAIRRNNEREHGLLYLAHSHVPTMWTRQGIELEKLEWKRTGNGSLIMERKLPNKVSFGTIIKPEKNEVRMEMWLTNGSDEMLSNLRVQNCIMFRGAPEFAQQTNDNKVLSAPYAACQSSRGNRWVITAWEPNFRTWGNPPCPCMHSDPQFPDCAPGETKRLRGWFSFYEGENIEAEFRRIEATGWRTRK
ncbi:MAG: polysaccharide deacetylase family protein [Planctomycetes bacterium]|nr:polysaccharide deacetylase family protein [Planctomycetota bacterium]